MTALQNILNEIDQLKINLSNLRPLPAEALKKLQEALDVEYTYESNRIEGNTLTLQETALVINEGVTISGKSMREHLEAINHAQAIEYIKDITKGDIEINEYLIKSIHAIILHGIDRDNAGKYRTVPVMISGSQYMPPQPFLIAPQMEAFINELQNKEATNEHPVTIAAFLHDELVRIHPFIDGNGRTSRLLMNLYLLSKGYVMITLKGDNDSKIQYYTALEKSHIKNTPTDFYILIAETERNALKKYIHFLE